MYAQLRIDMAKESTMIMMTTTTTRTKITTNEDDDRIGGKCVYREEMEIFKTAICEQVKNTQVFRELCNDVE